MASKKNIWIINQYSSTPKTGMGGRHYYLARELSKQGHHVHLIASASHHLLREKPKFEGRFHKEKIDGFEMVWVNLPSYKSAHSLKRVLNWVLFAWYLLKLPNFLQTKPQNILYSSPSLLPFLGAKRLAAKFGAKLIFDVRDLWPLTLKEIGGISPYHPLIVLFQWIENYAYKTSDLVVSNLSNAFSYMATKGLSEDKYSYIPNGISKDEINSDASLDSSVLELLPKDKFIVGYVGTLGLANSVSTLLQAAAKVDSANIAFVIVGRGKCKQELVDYSKENNLSNVVFLDSIPKSQVYVMLEQFDACYIGWMKSSLYRFGIGANKIPEYLASGRPILHAYSGGGDPIMDAKAGITVEAENSSELTQAILELYQMSVSDRKVFGDNGLKKAFNFYNYEVLATKLSNEIL